MPEPKLSELEQLQLDEAREAAQERRANRIQRDNRIAAMEISVKRDQFNRARTQAGCVHRKGGKGVPQLHQGNDTNYAVVTHTLSHGPTIVVCQRCGKLWEPPAKLSRKATAEDKTKYREDFAEYRRALSLPTDNEPSGTTLFAFSEPDQDAA